MFKSPEPDGCLSQLMSKHKLDVAYEVFCLTQESCMSNNKRLCRSFDNVCLLWQTIVTFNRYFIILQAPTNEH